MNPEQEQLTTEQEKTVKEVVTEVIAAMSHEVGNGLTPVLNGIELTLKRGVDDPNIRERLETARAAVVAIHKIISDFNIAGAAQNYFDRDVTDKDLITQETARSLAENIYPKWQTIKELTDGEWLGEELREARQAILRLGPIIERYRNLKRYVTTSYVTGVQMLDSYSSSS